MSTERKKMASYTSGPWEVMHSQTYGSHWIEDVAGRTIVDLYHYRLAESTPEKPVLFIKENAASNVHLIAAAPDMFEALEKLYTQALQSDVNDGNDWGREAIELAKSAIDKAKGVAS